MLQETKQPYHFGVGFIFAPAVVVTSELFLNFQKALANLDPELAFPTVNRDIKSGAFQLVRTGSAPLQVQLQFPGPPIAQLVIAANEPKRSKEIFVREADCVVGAFAQTFGAPAQVIGRQCTVRNLYSVRQGHAFKYLWEQRLGRSESEFAAFERPILGGGLRLVLPPRPNMPNDAMVELKFESLMMDSRMLFLECSMAWNHPAPGSDLSPGDLIDEVEALIDDKACPFIQCEA